MLDFNHEISSHNIYSNKNLEKMHHSEKDYLNGKSIRIPKIEISDLFLIIDE
jgi:hypothetical protein